MSATGLVSQKKKRLQQDNFDLDASFINCSPDLDCRLLAMAYPSEGREAWYRNSVKDVRRFLEHRQEGRGGTYKVYNLCAERPGYPADKLGGLLATYGFEDHQVPSLQQMQAFCQDLESFLVQHPRNFAAVHCKAGKGRTGVMICAYMLHRRHVANAEEAMETYARQRSKVSSGITVPSQQRYVRYYAAAVVMDKKIPAALPLALHGVTVSGLSPRQLAELVVVVSERCQATGEMRHLTELTASPASVTTQQATRYNDAVPMAELQPQAGPNGGLPECIVEGDVRIEVFLGRPTPKRLLFRTWLNTAFVSVGSYTLRAWELDKGAAPVKPGTVLRLQFADFTPGHTYGLPEAAAFQALQDTLPTLDLPRADSDSVQDMIPAISAPLPALSSSPVQTSPLPNLFEVHPDFGMPANFCLSPRGVPPTPPPTPPFNPFASPAAQQLPASPGGLRSHELSRCGTPVQELTERLESLAHATPQEEMGFPMRQVDLEARSQSSPMPWSKRLAFKDNLPPLRTLSLVRLRPLRTLSYPACELEDPELADLSAPTTPSLPRPFTSFDWQRGNSCESDGMPALNTHRSTSTEPGDSGYQSFFPFQEGTASGPDSPSHGARIIKWMSSSWWLSMA